MICNVTTTNNNSANSYNQSQEQCIFNEILTLFCKVTSLQIFCNFQHHNSFPFHGKL